MSAATAADTPKAPIVGVPLMKGDTSSIPQGVLFLNPGLKAAAMGDDLPRFVPQDLPMTPGQAAHYLQDMASFGSQFKRPSDMSGYLMEVMATAQNQMRGEWADLDKFSDDLSLDGMSRGPREATAEELDTARRTAQMVLLLAFNAQQTSLEAASIEKNMGSLTQKLASSLGMGEEMEALLSENVTRNMREAEAAIDNLSVGAAKKKQTQQENAPTEARGEWKQMLENLALFLPADGTLWATEPEMVELWLDSGIAAGDVPAHEVAALGLTVPEGTQVHRLSAEAFRLVGLDHPPLQRPWLNRTLTVYFT